MGANPLKRRLVPKKQLLASVLIGLGTLLIVFVLVALSVTPVQYDIEAGEVAPATITATRDVTDQISTDAAIEKARAQVPLMYTMDSTVTAAVQQSVTDYFALAKTANETLRDDYITWQVKEANYGFSRDYFLGLFDASEVNWSESLSQQQKDDVRTLLSDPNMPDNAIYALAALDAEGISNMTDEVTSIVAESLENGIR